MKQPIQTNDKSKNKLQSDLDYPDPDYLDFLIILTCFSQSGAVFFMNNVWLDKFKNRHGIRNPAFKGRNFL